jgi:deoxyribodipyrimidine photolyase
MKDIEQLLSTAPVHASRLHLLSAERDARGNDYVLYWMQKAQRSLDNPALELAMHLANALDLPRNEKKPNHCRKAFAGPFTDDSLFSFSDIARTEEAIGAGKVPKKEGQNPFGDLLYLQRIQLQPGQNAALERFEGFLASGGLERYGKERNDPNARAGSGMSAYLHFGQVSPARLAQKALDYSPSAAQVYVEQLVVRRELALNYVLYNPAYLDYRSAVPNWAQQSLATRKIPTNAYSYRELEEGQTDDPYWNAAQKELILNGAIHNYMRMYWGKQLLRWFSNPAKAFSVALKLNDCYSLDGRDPNGYAGIAWCFGRHDRPWPERQGFGKVRAMMASGLKKKFDADRYAQEMNFYILYE